MASNSETVTGTEETDRGTRLRDLATSLTEDDDIVDAFVAKSFTDRHMVVDLREGVSPERIADRLAAYDLHRAQEVYGDDHGTHFFAAEIDGAVRYHFVDTRTCGEHRSYVIE